MKQTKQPTAESTHRNYGIDLLRVLCMFYIVLFHNLGYGGVIAAAARGTSQHLLGRFL